MPTLHLRHELECDEATFWKTLFDAAFNERLFTEVLKFPHYELVERVSADGKEYKKACIEPSLGGLPAPVQKVLGDKLAYTEEGTYDSRARRYEFKVTPTTMADRMKIWGTIRTEALPGGRTARLVEAIVDVKIPLFGGLIEARILSDLRRSYDSSVALTNEYARSKARDSAA
jgi:hypothetical protein